MDASDQKMDASDENTGGWVLRPRAVAPFRDAVDRHCISEDTR
jgi:hypothetical protein